MKQNEVKRMAEEKLEARKQQPLERLVEIGKMLQARQQALDALTGDRRRTAQVVSILLSRCARQPELLACDPLSIYQAAHRICALGLSPLEERKHFSLQAWGHKHMPQPECRLHVEYRGLCHLAMQSGQIATIKTACVYRGELESFAYDEVTDALEHRMRLDISREDDDIVAVWARVVLKDGTIMTEVMPRADIDKRRAQSKGGNIWNAWFPEMARKTVLRKLMDQPGIPVSDSLAEALTVDIPADAAPILEPAPTRRRQVEAKPPPDYETVPELVTEQPAPDALSVMIERKEITLADADRLALDMFGKAAALGLDREQREELAAEWQRMAESFGGAS